MAIRSQDFFDQYAAAYQSYDADAVADMYFLPAVLMSDDAKSVYTSHDAIVVVIEELMQKFQALGVMEFEAEVCQAMKLSENIMFCNVKWNFRNITNEVVFSCFVSYTMQSDNEQLKIIVSVTDDEERELDRLLAENS